MTVDKVFDGDLTTFFDAAAEDGSGAWAGLDLGVPQVIGQIKYCPRQGWPQRMVGGVFQGSNSADFSGAVTLHTVTSAPPEETMRTQGVSNGTAFRYVRYLSAPNGWCNVAEVEFYGVSSAAPTPTPTPAPAPVLQGAVSRKTHGSAGSYEVELKVAAGTEGPGGPYGVECRQGGSMEVEIKFDKVVIGGEAEMMEGSATLSGNPAFEGSAMKLSLTGVGNAQTVKIRLKNIKAADGGKLASAVVAFRVLQGDVSGDGTVNILDLGQCQQRSGQPVGASNFRFDVNCDGAINIADLGITKNSSGKSVP